jgi:hypothetical protein
VHVVGNLQHLTGRPHQRERPGRRGCPAAEVEAERAHVRVAPPVDDDVVEE